MADEKVDFNLKAISPSIRAINITGNEGITNQTHLIEINLFLFVKIVRARNLFAHYGHYNFDPYVEVKAGNFQGRTLCFRRNSEPEWNQVFALDKDLSQTEEITTVEILVKDNVHRNDAYMSKISLDISNIPTRFPTDSELAPQWCLLEDRRGRRFRGELMMSCWVGTQADESFHEALHLQLDNAPIGPHHVVNTCSRTYIMPRIWCLRLNLVQIEGLTVKADDPSVSSDIFIHASLGTWTFTTKLAKSNNGNPTWEEKENASSALPTKTVDVIQNQGFVGKLTMTISLDGGYHMFDDDHGLPAMKPHGRTDAYCVAKYGPKWVRSRTVVNSLSPKWNELYSWNVYDQCTFFTICVFDNSQLHDGNIAAEAIDTRIGKVRICLQEMENGRIYTYSYPLLELQPSGLKKMGEIHLAFKFTCRSMENEMVLTHNDLVIALLSDVTQAGKIYHQKISFGGIDLEDMSD
ncbi:hypothetical protein TSUD_254110 [Trifolium subterraneum]|uniref:C2 domain-containing protein n=1 Tax=Trifolium subterraneum TaxID=3900 RepID=A0A2Z6P587_TRISU|nr:hypothetical protein TSUD_254110 [Trifolium subterraneum]